MFTVSTTVMGCDTHLETVTVAVIDPTMERMLGVVTVPNRSEGWEQVIELCRQTRVCRVGVEGASGFGRGLATRLVAEGVEVVEIPTRLTARIRTIDGGSKSDPGDATAIARATSRGEGSVWTYQPAAETLRVLTHHRQSLITDQTRAVNQLRALLIEIDPDLSARIPRLGRSKRPFQQLTATSLGTNPHHQTVGWLINQLATDCLRRIDQITELENRIKQAMPPVGWILIDQTIGCGLITAAQLLSELAGTDRFNNDAQMAAWAGTAPLDASSGKQQRHRLNRGGNRQANRAIHTIVVTQHRCNGPAADYINRRISEGKTRKEAIRAAKRHVTRHVYKIIRDHQLT